MSDKEHRACAEEGTLEANQIKHAAVLNTTLTTVNEKQILNDKVAACDGEEDIGEFNANDHSRETTLVDSNDYSVFTTAQKRAIILSGSIIGLLSYMSATVYYPVVNEIGKDLGVSETMINLTVTVYLITQGIVPVFVADFSDKVGRRPAFFVCFLFAIAANFGLALQNDYYAMLFLRILQAAGSYGTLAQGLIGDCIVSAQRGQYIAYTSLAVIVGPSVCPVLGGLIGQYAGWHWIFWFLLICTVVCFIPLVLFLPETCRTVVGNHSIPPPWICTNVSDSIRFKHRETRHLIVDRKKQDEIRRNGHITIPSPVSALQILTDRGSALLLLCLSLAMACYYAIFIDISHIFVNLYSFSIVQTSLVALTIGGGCLLSTITTGILVDWNYRRHARKLKLELSKTRQMDLSNFPVEVARLEVTLPPLILGAIGVIVYGWTLRSSISPAVPIICLFFMGYGVTATTQNIAVLMADIHPGKFATAAAARNICQNFIGAGASAAIRPMTQAMGQEWAYTFLGLLYLAGSAGLVITMRNGMAWRQEKKKAQDNELS